MTEPFANPVIGRQGSASDGGGVGRAASIRFWPGQWIKITPTDGAILATREEIMLALENVEYILIK